MTFELFSVVFAGFCVGFATANLLHTWKSK